MSVKYLLDIAQEVCGHSDKTSLKQTIREPLARLSLFAIKKISCKKPWFARDFNNE